VSNLYKGFAGMGKNIVLKGDIDIKSVVAKVVKPNGDVEDLKHCGVQSVKRDKKHRKLVTPIDVKLKPKGLFAVEFVLSWHTPRRFRTPDCLY